MVTLEELHYRKLDSLGWQITDAIGRCRDENRLDELLRMKDELNALKA